MAQTVILQVSAAGRRPCAGRFARAGPAQPRSARSTRAGTAIVVAVDLLDGGHAR